MARDVMLTTIDNPFNPFTQYDEWEAYDMQKGHHTTSYLARIAMTSVNFPESMNDEEWERAMDEIIKLNPLGIYKKVFSET